MGIRKRKKMQCLCYFRMNKEKKTFQSVITTCIRKFRECIQFSNQLKGMGFGPPTKLTKLNIALLRL